MPIKTDEPAPPTYETIDAEPTEYFPKWSGANPEQTKRQNLLRYQGYIRRDHVNKGYAWTPKNEQTLQNNLYEALDHYDLFEGKEESSGELGSFYSVSEEQKLNLIQQWSPKHYNEWEAKLKTSEGLTREDESLLNSHFDAAKQDLVDQGEYAAASIGDDIKTNSSLFQEDGSYTLNIQKSLESGILDPAHLSRVTAGLNPIEGSEGLTFSQYEEFSSVTEELEELLAPFQGKDFNTEFDRISAMEGSDEKDLQERIIMAIDMLTTDVDLAQLQEDGEDAYQVHQLATLLERSRQADRGTSVASAPSRKLLYHWLEEQTARKEMMASDYDSDNLQANIKKAGLTGVVVHPKLSARQGLFAQAIETSDLTDLEKSIATINRNAQIEAGFTKYDTLLSNSRATSDKWIQHKTEMATREGKKPSNREIFDTFLADDKNYSAFSNFGGAAWDAIWHGGIGTLAAAIPAMAGSEGARNYLIEVTEDANRRHQVANFFGSWEGAVGTGIHVAEVFIPAMVDIGMGVVSSYATGGLAAAPTAAYLAWKQGVKSTVKSSIKNSVARKVSKEASDQVLTSMNQATVKSAVNATAEQVRAGGLKTFWKEFGDKTIQFSGATFTRRVAGGGLTSFTRSAGSTYANVYSILAHKDEQLPDDQKLGHEGIHQAALGTGITAGLFTAGITLGFSAFGKGGLEKALEKGLTGREITHVLKTIGKGISRINHVKSRDVAAKVVEQGLAKNTLFRNAFKSVKGVAGDMLAEAVEEGIDEAFNTALVQMRTEGKISAEEVIRGALMGALLGGLTGGLAGVTGSAVRRTTSALGLTDSVQQQQAFADKVTDDVISKLEEAGSPLAAAELRKFTRAVVSGADVASQYDTRERAATSIDAPVQPRADQMLPLADRSDRVRETTAQLAEEEESHRAFDRYQRAEHASALEALQAQSQEGALVPLELTSETEKEFAKADPDYNLSPEGDIIGIRNPFTGQWVGQPPSDQEYQDKLTAFRETLPQELRDRRTEHESNLQKRSDVISSVESGIQRLATETKESTKPIAVSDSDVADIVSQLEGLVTPQSVADAINVLAEQQVPDSVRLPSWIESSFINTAFPSKEVVSEAATEETVETKEAAKPAEDPVTEAIDNLEEAKSEASILAEANKAEEDTKPDVSVQTGVNGASQTSKAKDKSTQETKELNLPANKKAVKKKKAKKKKAKRVSKAKLEANEFIQDKYTAIEVSAFNALVHAGEPVVLEAGKYGMPVRKKLPKDYYKKKTELLSQKINEKYPKKPVARRRGVKGLRGADNKVIREDGKVAAYVDSEGIGIFNNNPDTVALLLSRGVPVRVPSTEDNINPRIVFDDKTGLVKEVIYRDKVVGLNIVNEPLPTFTETLQKTSDLIELFVSIDQGSGSLDFSEVANILRPEQATKGEPRLRADVAEQAGSAVRLEATLLEMLLNVRQQLINDGLVATKETNKGTVLIPKKGAVNSFLDIWSSLDSKGAARVIADSLPILGNPASAPSFVIFSFLKDFVLNNNMLESNTMPEVSVIANKVKERYHNLQKRRALSTREKVWRAAKGPLDESQNPVGKREFASLVDPVVAAGLPQRAARIVTPLTSASVRLLKTDPITREKVNNFLARKVYSRSSRAYVESLSDQDALGALFGWATSGPNEDADINTLFNYLEQLPKGKARPLTTLLRMYWTGSDATMGNLDQDSGFRGPFRAFASRILGANITDRQASNIIRSIRSASIELFANSYASSLTQEQITESNQSDVARLDLASGDPESVISAFKKILSKSNNPLYKIAAKILLQNSEFIRRVSFVIAEKGTGYAGKYTKSNSGEHTVAIFLDGHNGSGVEGVLLHEYLHALTADVVAGISPRASQNTGDFSNVRTAEQEAALSQITDLMVEINRVIMEQGSMDSLTGDALSNPDEFIAYVFTSPEFQQILRTLPKQKAQKNFLHRVLDKLLGLFNIKVPSDERSLYNEALEKITAFTNTVNKTGTGSATAVSGSIERNANSLLEANANTVEVLNALQGAPAREVVGEIPIQEPPANQVKREKAIRAQLDKALLSSLADGTPAEQVVSKTKRARAEALGGAIMSRLQSHARRHNVQLVTMSSGQEQQGHTALMSGGEVQVSIGNLVSSLFLNESPMTSHAVVKSVDYIFNEEINHVAAVKAVDKDAFDKLVEETDEREFQDIANEYYKLDDKARDQSLARLASKDPDVVAREKRMLMDENLRIQTQMRTRGTTTEDAILFFRTKPSAAKVILQAVKNMYTRMVVAKRYSKENPRYYQALKNLKEEVEAMTRGYRYDSGSLAFDPASPAESLYVLTDQLTAGVEGLEGLAFDEDYQELVTKGDKGTDNLQERLNLRFTNATRKKEIAEWRKRNPKASDKLTKIVSDKLKESGFGGADVPDILLNNKGEIIPVSRRISPDDKEERRAAISADKLEQSIVDWRLALQGDLDNDPLQPALDSAAGKVTAAFESGESLMWPNAGLAGDRNDLGPKTIWSTLNLRYPDEGEIADPDDLNKVKDYTHKLVQEKARNEAYVKWSERNPNSHFLLTGAVRVGQESEGMDQFYHGTYNHFNPLYEFNIYTDFDDPNPTKSKTSTGTTKGFSATPIREYAEGWASSGQGTSTLGSKLVDLNVEQEFNDIESKQEFMEDYMQVSIGGLVADATPRSLYPVAIRTTNVYDFRNIDDVKIVARKWFDGSDIREEIETALKDYEYWEEKYGADISLLEDTQAGRAAKDFLFDDSEYILEEEEDIDSFLELVKGGALVNSQLAKHIRESKEKELAQGNWQAWESKDIEGVIKDTDAVRMKEHGPLDELYGWKGSKNIPLDRETIDGLQQYEATGEIALLEETPAGLSAKEILFGSDMASVDEGDAEYWSYRYPELKEGKTVKELFVDYIRTLTMSKRAPAPPPKQKGATLSAETIEALQEYTKTGDVSALEETQEGLNAKRVLFGSDMYTIDEADAEWWSDDYPEIKEGTTVKQMFVDYITADNAGREEKFKQAWRLQQSTLDPTNIYVTNSKVIKLSDPVTWDNEGRIIDIDSRNNFDSVDIRLSSVRATHTVDRYYKDLLTYGDKGSDNLLEIIKGGLIADTSINIERWIDRNPATAEKINLINEKLSEEQVYNFIELDQQGNVILPVARFDLNPKRLSPYELSRLNSQADLGQYARAMKDNPDPDTVIEPFRVEDSGFNPWDALDDLEVGESLDDKWFRLLEGDPNSTEALDLLEDEAIRKGHLVEGKPIKAFHGSTQMRMRAFDKKFIRRTAAGGFGFYFAGNKNASLAYGYADEQGGRTYPVFLKANKVFEVEGNHVDAIGNSEVFFKELSEGLSERYNLTEEEINSVRSNGVPVMYLIQTGMFKNKIEQLAEENTKFQKIQEDMEAMGLGGATQLVSELSGYDAVHYKKDDVWIVYQPEQIKSAEVTRDDFGDVIPLSRRFDDGPRILYSSVKASPTDRSNIPLDIGQGRKNLGAPFKQLLQMPFFHTGEYNKPLLAIFSGSLDPRVRELDDNRRSFQRMVTAAITKYKNKLDKLLKKSFGSIEAAPADLLRDAIGSTEGAYASDEKIAEIEKEYEDSIADISQRQRDKKISFDQAKQEYEDAGTIKSKAIRKAEQEAADDINKRKTIALQTLSRTPNGKELVAHLVSLRNMLDDISSEVKSLYNLSNDVSAHFDSNMGIYLTRTYKMFTEVDFGKRVMTDPNYADVRSSAADFFEDQFIGERVKHLRTHKGMGEEEAKAQAAQEIKDYQRENKSRLGMDAVQEYLDSFEYQAQQAIKHSTGSPLKPMLDSLKQKKKVPKALRALLGENVDEGNVDNIFRTINTVGMMASNQAFLQHTANLGRESNWLFTQEELTKKIEELEAKGDTKKASYYRSFTPVRGREKLGGAARSGKHDPFTNFINEDGVNQGVLLGPPEFSQGLESHFAKLNQLSTADTVFWEKTFTVVSRLTGLSLAMKTLGGFPGFYLRNAMSNLLYFGPMQGLLPGTGLSQLVKQSAKGTSTLFSRTKDIDIYKLRLVGLGLIGDEVQATTVRDLLNGNTTMDSMVDELEAVLKKAEGLKDKALKPFKGLLNTAQLLSQSIDAAHKIAYFEHDLQVLREARDHANATNDGSIYEGRTDEELERMAAKRVILTSQSYSQTLPIVKGAQKSFVGVAYAPFLRFKTEVPRVAVNSAKLVHEEFHSGNAVMKKRGAQRLAGMLFTIGGMSVALPLILRGVLDIGDEEDQTARTWAPDYAKGNTFFYSEDTDGNPLQWDLTFINPFALLVDPFMRGFESLLNGRFDSVLGDIAGSFLRDVFFEDQILLGTMEESLRDNKDPDNNDNPIVESTDEGLDKYTKVIGYIYRQAFEPKAFKALNEAADRIGEDLDDWDETPLGRLAREVRPFRIRKMNPDKGFGTHLKNMSDEYSRARGKKNMLLSDRREFTEQEIRDMVQEEYRRIGQIHKSINANIRGAKAFGYTKEEAFRKMKSSNISKARLYMLDKDSVGRLAPSKEWLFNIQNREGLADGKGKRRLDIFMDEWNKLPVLEPIKE